MLVEGRRQYTAANAFSFAVHSNGNTPRPAPNGTAYLLGQVAGGNRASTGQRDDWDLTLTQTTRIVFDARSDNAQLSWTLAGPRGRVSRGFQSSDSRDFAANPVLELAPGTYTVSIGGNTTGSYAFRLIDIAAAAMPIVPGTPVDALLQPGSETEVYAFDAAPGSRLFFDLLSATSTDVQWRLLSPANAQVWTSLLGDVGPVALPVAGRYTLLVEGRRNAAADNALASSSFRCRTRRSTSRSASRSASTCAAPPARRRSAAAPCCSTPPPRCWPPATR